MVRWNPQRRAIRPHLEVAELTAMAEAGNWAGVVEQANVWLDAWPDQLAPYEWTFIGLTHRDGIPAAEAWARATLARTNGVIRGYLSAAIVLHVLIPAKVGDWRNLSPQSAELELVGLAEQAWRESRKESRWASCALPIVRALQGECEVARRLAAEARSLHHLQQIERGWLAAVDCLADAGDGNVDGARAHLQQLLQINPDSRYVPAAEASLEVAAAGGLAVIDAAKD